MTAARASATKGFAYRSSLTTGATAEAANADEAIRLRVSAAVDEMRSSPFYAALLGRLRRLSPFGSIVCLGVGRFASTRSARYQLALAFLLRDDLLAERAPAGIGSGDGHGCIQHDDTVRDLGARPGGESSDDDGRLHIFDPALDEAELAFVRQQTRTRLRLRNEEGRVAMCGRSLYMLLHCSRVLYSNLLEANWGAARLPHIAVLGNSFCALAEAPLVSRADRESTAGWCRVTRAAPLVTEESCDTLGGGRASDFDHAFNNTSLHTFDAAVMPPPDDALWTRPFSDPPRGGGAGVEALLD